MQRMPRRRGIKRWARPACHQIPELPEGAEDPEADAGAITTEEYVRDELGVDVVS